MAEPYANLSTTLPHCELTENALTQLTHKMNHILKSKSHKDITSGAQYSQILNWYLKSTRQIYSITILPMT